MKTKSIILLFLLSIIINIQSIAQYNISFNTQRAINNNTRSLDGKPGSKYWVNKGVYKIDVELDPTQAKIVGSETIKYQNNSPDTLTTIVLSVLSDGYRKNATRDYSWDIDNFNDGVDISYLSIDGQQLTGDQMKRSGTNRTLIPPTSVLPGGSIDIKVDWSFSFPDIQIRCGDFGDSTFFIAYFYPRVAVYDDIDGWDRGNYTMMTEFYSDFNDYDVNVTVPKDFVVWATGNLQNAKKVLRKSIYKKFKKANKTEQLVHVITLEDIHKGHVTQQNKKLIYHYKASHVPDFAFATSDKFLWDARMVEVDHKTNRSVFISAAYRQDSKDYTKIANLTAKVIHNYSTRIPGVPYPYPAMTIFNGNSGMEFPMMCNDASSDNWVSSAGLTYHEVAHTYFPFYMGTNERKYAWMDEGWASFMPMFYIEREDTSATYDYIVSRANRYYSFAGSDGEIPIMTLSKDIKSRGPYRYTSYNKSYFAYYYLYKMLGEESFKKCLQGYMQRWNGKHPIPYDFFHSFNDLSGMDLTWFWESWFFQRNHADLAVKLSGERDIIIENKGGLAVPVYLTVTYDNNKVETIHKEANIWSNLKCNNTLMLKPTYKGKITKIELGDKYILDVNTSDNIWKKE